MAFSSTAPPPPILVDPPQRPFPNLGRTPDPDPHSNPISHRHLGRSPRTTPTLSAPRHTPLSLTHPSAWDVPRRPIYGLGWPGGGGGVFLSVRSSVMERAFGWVCGLPREARSGAGRSSGLEILRITSYGSEIERWNARMSMWNVERSRSVCICQPGGHQSWIPRATRPFTSSGSRRHPAHV